MLMEGLFTNLRDNVQTWTNSQNGPKSNKGIDAHTNAMNPGGLYYSATTAVASRFSLLSSGETAIHHLRSNFPRCSELQATPFTPCTKNLHSSHEVQILFSGLAT